MPLQPTRARVAARFTSMLLVVTLLVLSLLVLLPLPSHGAPTSLSAVDYDPDEMEGLPEATSTGEVILDDDADEEAPAVAQSIWVDPNQPLVPPGAHDPERTVKSLDWVHVQYEVRTVREKGDQRPGQVIETTRKHGRAPWIVEIGSGTAIPQVEQALLGLTIGERKTIELSWRDEFAALQPHTDALGEIEPGQTVGIHLEVVRFDQDFKELTLEERSVLGRSLVLVSPIGHSFVSCRCPSRSLVQVLEHAPDAGDLRIHGISNGASWDGRSGAE
jgi:hypothetical protein